MNEGKWITLKDGRHILLKPKPIVMNDTNFYMNNKIRGKKETDEETQEQIEKNIDDMLNNGNVFDFGVGPKNTFIALKKNGMSSFSVWDAPITLATQQGILQQLDIGETATAKVWDDQINIRSNYFKRNGYKVVGKKREEGSAIVYLLVRREK